MRVRVFRLSRGAFGVADDRVYQVGARPFLNYPGFADGAAAVAADHRADDVPPVGQAPEIDVAATAQPAT